MRYASVDIETTGLDPETCQVLEIGVVLDDLGKQLPAEELPSFHCYVDNGRIQGDAAALAMNAGTLGKIAKRELGVLYLRPEEVGSSINNFFRENRMKDRVTAAGKNFGAFDLQFLRRLPGSSVWFRHRHLDPAAYFCRAGREEPPSLKECMEMAGVGGEVPHTAVEDARLVVRVLRAGWNRVHGLGREELPLGRYQHFKGIYYNVVAVSRNSECPDEQLVTYVDDEGHCWSRPLSMFLAVVDGQPRFRRVS